MSWSVNRAGPVIAVALVVAVVVAACSGGDDATTTTVEVSPTTVPVVSTDPPESTSTTVEVTTTVESTTTVPPTTVPEPTTPATSDPTTTTLPEGAPPRLEFPDDPDKQAVVDAAYEYFDALNLAQASPESQEPRTLVEAATDEPIRQRVIAYLDSLVADGQAFVDLGVERSHIEIYGDVITVVEGRALVEACVIDRTSQVEIGGNGDGTDRVLNDQVVAALLSYSVVESELGWRVVDLSVLDQFEGSDRCVE